MTIDQPVSEFFTAGGTLPPGAPSYVKRPTDDELYRHIMAGEFCYVLTPRQMGKSSLMIRTAQRLSEAGVRSAIVDLTQIGTVDNEDQWYKGILTQIKRRLKLSIDPVTWWEQRRDIPNIQKFIEFFEEMLSEVKEHVVIFMDEIDTTLKLDFRDDFFAGIRAMFNARAENPDLNRITFVLLGVASPSDLIKDRNRTPFNIGQEIPLRPFSREDARMLEIGLEETYPKFGQKILDRVFYWTNGHPYLTQKMCQSVVESHLKNYSDKEVDELIEKLFVSKEAARETNLQFVRDNLLNYPKRRDLLLLYQKVLIRNSKTYENKNSLLQNQLKLSGVAIVDNGKLTVGNRIYRKVFDIQWARQSTPNNWPKIVATLSVVFSLFLLSILVYNYVVGSLSSQYAGDFYTNLSSSERLGNLAKLFELHGLLTNTDYDFRARELFYSLNWNDQTKLFKDSYTSLSDKQKYLLPVVEGLYVTMADVAGDKGNSDLLGIMRDSLKDIKTTESSGLQREINLWLEARNASNDQDALIKYDKVINSYQNNPATHYERALVAIRLGQFDQALVDLDATMGLAQNVSSEASENEIATPTQRLVVTQPSVTEQSQLPTQTPPIQTVVAITHPAETVETPLLTTTQIPDVTLTPNNTPLRVGYKSSFYSIAYIRSAVNLVIQENNGKPDFDNALIANFSKLTNLKDAGLINSLDLARLATQAANSLKNTITFQPTYTLPPPSTCVGWEFSTDGDSEGWQIGQGVTSEVLGGSLRGDITQPGGFWAGPDNLDIDATVYKLLEMRYRIDSPEASDIAYFYWTKADDPQFGNNKRVKFDIQTNNTWQDMSVDLTQNINWNGIITGIHLYPAWFSNLGAPVEYDYIRLCGSIANNGQPLSVQSTPTAVILDNGVISDIANTPASTGQQPLLCSTPNLPIPDMGTLNNTISVPDVSMLSGLDVYLHILHTSVSDLVITLNHVNGSGPVTLIDRLGCTGSDIDVTINDQGLDGNVVNQCEDAPAIHGNRMGGNPAGPVLSTFDGNDFSGDWVLTINDNSGGDVGTLVEWCLIPTIK